VISYATNRSYFSVLILLTVCFCYGHCSAFNEADLARLMSSKECKFCNLHSADLSGAQLVGAQLSNVILSHAKLSNANLSRANLSGAFLSRSDLSDANLTEAFLVDANLNQANISGANLTGADLSGAIWTNGTKCEKKSVGECKQADLLGKPK